MLESILDGIEREFYTKLKSTYESQNNASRDYYAAGLSVIDKIRGEIAKRLSIHKTYDKREIGNE